MRHQDFHFSGRNQLSLLFAIFFLFLTFSCNQTNDKKGSVTTTSKDTGQIISKDTAQKFIAPLANATVPVFRIEREDLQKLFDSSEKYKKIIIKVGLTDLSDFSTMKILVYPAKNQGHHGNGTNPLQNITTKGTTNIDAPLIIGNNYIGLKKILKKIDESNRVFTYLLLTPANGTGTNENHLVFNITAFTTDKDKVTILSSEDLGNTNPSPPADPGS